MAFCMVLLLQRIFLLDLNDGLLNSLLKLSSVTIGRFLTLLCSLPGIFNLCKSLEKNVFKINKNGKAERERAGLQSPWNVCSDCTLLSLG